MVRLDPRGGRPAEFLALGDSYTIGEGVEAAQRWPLRALFWLTLMQAVFGTVAMSRARPFWFAGAVTTFFQSVPRCTCRARRCPG